MPHEAVALAAIGNAAITTTINRARIRLVIEVEVSFTSKRVDRVALDNDVRGARVNRTPRLRPPSLDYQ
jgi:hypothetical protein